jgi:hypothetical protein
VPTTRPDTPRPGHWRRLAPGILTLPLLAGLTACAGHPPARPHTTLTLHGQATTMRTTVTAVADPATPASPFWTPAQTDRIVAIRLRLTNTGTQHLSDDIAAEALLSDAAGQSFHTTGFPTTTGARFPHGEVDLDPGETGTGVLSFVVPHDATGLRLRLTLPSGFSSPTGDWQV